MRMICFFILICGLLSGLQTWACNGLDMTLETAIANLNTNNFPALNVNVRRNNVNTGCNYFVVIDYGAAGSFSTRKLDQAGGFDYPVQIYKDTGRTQIIKRLSDATSANDILDGVFPERSGSTTATLTYRPYLDPSLYRRFGAYSQNFTVSLYQGSLGASPTLRRSRTLTLNYTQARRIDLSIVNTGASFDLVDTSQTLDFGSLLTATPQSCDLILQYNAGYRLSVSSANSGALKHQTSANLIPYHLQLNGAVLNLSSGSVTLPNVTGISPAGGSRLPILVTTGSASGKPSGLYSDTITISVVSAE